MPVSSSSASPNPCNFVDNVDSDAAVVASVQVGDNANDGSPEATLSCGSSASGADGVWDTDLADGFSSGIQDFSLTVEAGGSASWNVIQTGGSLEASLNDVPVGFIKKVQIRSAVAAGNCAMEFRVLTVRYFKSGSSEPQDIEVVAEQCNPQASTAGQPDPATASRILQSTPIHNDNIKVTIVGRLLLRCWTLNHLPPAESMLGQIFVFTSNS